MKRIVFHDPCSWTISSSSIIRDSLHLFRETLGKPLLVTSGNYLVGVFSQGDLRDALISNVDLDSSSVLEVCTKDYVSAPVGVHHDSLYSLLVPPITAVPIVDSEGKVNSVAVLSDVDFHIGNQIIKFDDDSHLLIGEIGVNHNGSFDTATRIVDLCTQYDIHAVKLQFRSPDLYGDSPEHDRELQSEYIQSELSRNSLSFDEEANLAAYIKSKGHLLVITPFDIASAHRAIESNPDCLKIASCDLSNEPLLEFCAKSGLPLIISTGMSLENEIIKACQVVSSHSANYAFLHTNSTYPAPRADLNLRYIQRLKKLTSSITGYSSHDGSVEPIYLSIGVGAKIIEFHVTLDKAMPGTDHRASLDATDLASLSSNVTSLFQSLGHEQPRQSSDAEKLNRLALGKSLHYAKDLPKGSLLTKADIVLKSPANGVPWDKLGSLLGQPCNQDVRANTLVKYSHFLNSQSLDLNPYNLSLDPYIWGLPVRYRDYSTLYSKFDPKVLEFHLSTSDLEYDVRTLNLSCSNVSVLFHAIEQYSDGFILDFCSDDDSIYLESLSRFQNIFAHIQSVRSSLNLPSDSSIGLITNCGGFSFNSELDSSDKERKTALLISTLNKLSLAASNYNINILPQTMPPFPWLQGGTAFHNLLCTPQSLLEVLTNTGLQCCLDTSHTLMSANHFGFDFYDLVNHLSASKLISHWHISDASGTTGEGLMPGDGEIDFKRLLQSLRLDHTFIPEVWMGHQNEGLGFYHALNRISSLL